MVNKALAVQQEDLSLHLRAPTEEARDSKQDAPVVPALKRILGAYWSTILAKSVSYRFSGRSYPRKYSEDQVR